MRPRWKIILILTVILLLAFSATLAWSEPEKATVPAFGAKDRATIEAFYLHVIETLAPGSINRTSFPLGIERALAVGSRVPMQLEKDLMPLPVELESKLVPLTGDYRRFKLGNHIVLVKMADLAIVDIIKNAGLK
jgi:hypothetical protein